MKYFVIISTFNNPLPVDTEGLQKLIKDHQQYLKRGFDEGWILISGPKAAGGGGMILMKAASIEEVEEYFAKDPMKTAGIQEYVITEFKLHECQTEIKNWFN